MSVRARVAKLHAESPAGRKVKESRRWWAMTEERFAAFDHFDAAGVGLPFEFGGEFDAAGVFTEDHYRPPPTSPLWFRLLCGFFKRGWFPNPLPGAWAEWVEANPAAPFDGEDCEGCGLLHPAGVTRCLYCSGAVARDAYRKRHGRPNFINHDTTPIGLNGGKSIGWYLLHRGDPNVFDPMRRTTPDDTQGPTDADDEFEDDDEDDDEDDEP